MPNNQNKSSETYSQKPNITESVDNLIAKKKAEKENESENAVRQSAKSVQGEVAEVMGEVEKPSEKISERKGESGEQGDIKSTGSSSDDSTTIKHDIAQYIFPGEDVMIRKVRLAITAQIKKEEKLAKKLEKNLTSGSAQEYSSAIARIRQLKEILVSLLHTTVEAIKELYKKYFTPKGRRK